MALDDYTGLGSIGSATSTEDLDASFEDTDFEILDKVMKPESPDSPVFIPRSQATSLFMNRRQAGKYIASLMAEYDMMKPRVRQHILARAKVKTSSELAERLGSDDLYSKNVMTYRVIALSRGKYAFHRSIMLKRDP